MNSCLFSISLTTLPIAKEDFLAQFVKTEKPKDSSPSRSKRGKKSSNIDRARSRSPKKREEPQPEPSSEDLSDTELEWGLEETEMHLNELVSFSDSLKYDSTKVVMKINVNSNQ
jgi:hypothetical protein